jgi:hypothetical protein
MKIRKVCSKGKSNIERKFNGLEQLVFMAWMASVAV